jgi:hypothetical protein
MIEGAGVTDGSITHVLPYLLLQPSGGCDWKVLVGSEIPSLSVFSAGFDLFFGLERGGLV